MFLKQLKIPQIRPINWLLLFMFFNFRFYLLMVKNFYLVNKVFNYNKRNKVTGKNSYSFEL